MDNTVIVALISSSGSVPIGITALLLNFITDVSANRQSGHALLCRILNQTVPGRHWEVVKAQHERIAAHFRTAVNS